MLHSSFEKLISILKKKLMWSSIYFGSEKDIQAC